MGEVNYYLKKADDSGNSLIYLDAPIKVTTSGRSKLTSYFAGEDLLFKYVSS